MSAMENILKEINFLANSKGVNAFIRGKLSELHRTARTQEAVIERLVSALDQSLKLQSHYAKLLNMHDGGARLEFADTEAWLKRLNSHGQSGTTPSE